YGFSWPRNLYPSQTAINSSFESISVPMLPRSFKPVLVCFSNWIIALLLILTGISFPSTFTYSIILLVCFGLFSTNNILINEAKKNRPRIQGGFNHYQNKKILNHKVKVQPAVDLDGKRPASGFIHAELAAGST